MPCISQAAKWNNKDVLTYEIIKSMADKIIYIEQEYTNDCMFKRNRFLVDYTSICVSYQYKNSGVSAYTTKYARSKNLKLYNLCKSKPLVKLVVCTRPRRA